MMDITGEIITDFRVTFPAFTSIVVWPDTVLTQALCEADAETGGVRWGQYDVDCHNFKKRGMYYFAAHWASSMYVQGAANPSAVDPAARLNLSAKSVADESVQFRITAIQATGDDWLSTTIYGTQFIRLRDRAGRGGFAA